MKNDHQNRRILFFEELPSTNDVAMRDEALQHLDAVMAARQSAGRGRHGRSFHSAMGGLYLSVVLSPDKVACTAALATVAASLSVLDALRAHGISGISLKWVNDLLLDGKKVCGILTEGKSEGGKLSRIVVGIGINLRAPEGGFPAELRDRAADIGYTGDPHALAEAIISRLAHYTSMESEALAAAYSGELALIGEEISVVDYGACGTPRRGTFLGVDGDCRLCLRTEDGTTHVITSGEIVF